MEFALATQMNEGVSVGKTYIVVYQRRYRSPLGRRIEQMTDQALLLVY